MFPVYLYQKDKMALPVSLVVKMIKTPRVSLHPPGYLSLSLSVCEGLNKCLNGRVT
jgi:hypothetical protein